MRLVPLLCLLAAPAFAGAMTPESAKDPFIWLEDANGARALDWVRAENAKSLSVLKADPHYETFYQQALAIGQAQDRIPEPALLNGQVFNFWQDAGHVRGIWRRVDLAGYRAAAPRWTTVLDVDALATAEHGNYVWKGSTCLEPEERLCLVALSDGGEDALTMREFDVAKAAFVAGGFVLPRSKMVADWENADSLLVATDWGPGSMTASGYPFIVKRVKRGRPMAAAQEVFRGTAKDVSVNPVALSDGAGHHAMVLQQGLDFFHSAWFLVGAGGVTKLDVPAKADLVGLVDNQLVVKLNEDWKPNGAAAIPAGALASLDLGKKGAAPRAVFVPGARQSVDHAAVSRDRVVASVYDNVRGRVMAFALSGKGWVGSRLALPDNVATEVVSSSLRDNQVFAGVDGFLTPASLWLADLSGGAPVQVKQSPPRFDASRDVVEQFDAKSKDGTRVPYFVVRPKDMKLDGSNPTLQYAYGGFGVSMIPYYSGTLGKLWLEHGGVYVQANIRGGGEFGPAWHDAALKTHRQRGYDDFAAVAQDIIARKITSPRRLGIEGGSNGGLLMGVEFEQHPELWNATVIQVPLLDMLRYEKIAAGASWVGEYGSVSKPDELANLQRLSPYANLRAGVKYPVPFLYTTTKDDRVGPQHARKFAAKMAEMGLPFLYYEAIEGGHGAGANIREKAEERALEMTYLTRQLMQ